MGDFPQRYLEYLLWVTITLKRYRSLKRAISSFNSKVAFMGFLFG